MNKYGIEHFTIENIEECSDSIVNEREQYWIKFYNSYYDGYNATLGGEGSVKYDRDYIYELYKQGKTLKEICELLNCDKEIPHNVLVAKGINPLKENNQKNKELYGKKCQAILKDGSIISFQTLSDGARFVINSGLSVDTIAGVQTHIGQVCNGKRKTAYGIRWEFI